MPCRNHAFNSLNHAIPSGGGRCAKGGCHRCTQRARHPSRPLQHARTQDIAVVPTEQFISPVTRQRDGHLLPGQSGHQEGWDLGAVRKGLVIYLRQQRYHRKGVLRLDIEFRVGCAEVSRHCLGVVRLVVPRPVESDGEGPDRLGALGLHQGHD